MTSPESSISDRKERRAEYWNRKHCAADWHEDIHFAVFPDEWVNEEAFNRGIKFNTEELRRELMDELASLYWLSRGANVLDFGCGAGDLLLQLAHAVPNLTGVGVDISSSAIARAQNRLETRTADTPHLGERIRFQIGGVEALEHLCSSGAKEGFDVIACRDVFYLLDATEQQQLLAACRTLLRPGGIVFIADLAVEAGHVDTISGPLLQRQFGGVPITWTFDGRSGERVYSIQDAAATQGLEYVREPDADERAVTGSYHVAWNIAKDDRVKQAFAALSEGAAPPKGRNAARVPYVRFYFGAAPTIEAPGDNDFGLVLHEDFAFVQDKPILRKGSWTLPRNHWSLILGRSGVGKSTLLGLFYGLTRDARRSRIGNWPSTSFFLGQRPELIEQLNIEENIALFAKSWSLVGGILDDLGIDAQLRRRRADERLSGGERQRVALGQAIASWPELLLLDEPCAGIDRIRKYHFFSTIRESFSAPSTVSDRPTVVCVDHEFLQIEGLFDFIFEIIHGQLICVRGPKH